MPTQIGSKMFQVQVQLLTQNQHLKIEGVVYTTPFVCVKNPFEKWDFHKLNDMIIIPFLNREEGGTDNGQYNTVGVVIIFLQLRFLLR